jgi:hypothetical protein
MVEPYLLIFIDYAGFGFQPILHFHFVCFSITGLIRISCDMYSSSSNINNKTSLFLVYIP